MEQKNQFAIGATLSKSWERVTKNLAFYVGLTIIFGAINGALNLVGGSPGPNPTPDQIANTFSLSMFGGILSVIVSFFMLQVFIRSIDDEKPQLGDAKYWRINWNTFLNYVVGSILYTIIITLGFIALIIPGIYLAVKYGLYQYFIIDKDVQFPESYKLSADATKGVKLALIGLGLVLVLVNILGAIVFLVGLLITIPMSMVAMVYVYRQLAENSQA